MKKIDLTVVAFDSNIVRAYLTYMKSNGIMPSKIIALKMDKRINTKTKRIINIFLGNELSTRILLTIRRLRKNLKYRKISELLLNGCELIPDFAGQFNYSEYADSVEEIHIDHINDDKLYNYLSGQDCKTFLFTGGGILRDKILGINAAKFIHIHPGIVPDVKGSDGFFWSFLLRGKAGASGFYMNVGIDTGDIIIQHEFDIPVFRKKLLDYSYDDIYRSILLYLDPIIRAKLLVKLLELYARNGSFSALPVTKQDPEGGRTYYFMHKRLRNRVINKLIANN